MSVDDDRSRRRGVPGQGAAGGRAGDLRDPDVFHAAVQMSRMPTVLVDPRQPDYPVVFCNQAFCDLTGYGESEVLGRNCRFLQGRLTDPAAVRALREALQARRTVQVELWNYRKDGTPFWNAMFVSPVFDAEGDLLYVLGSQFDATARREAEEARGRALRMDALGTMAAGIAHEFNNLMAVVVGNVEGAAAEPSSPRQAKRLERANRAAHAAGRLTQQMLSFARRQRLEAELVDLNKVVSEFDQVLIQMAGPHVALGLALAAEPVPARVDVGQLELALINLVRNASDASTNGGRLTVATRALPAGGPANPLGGAGAVAVSVSDAGSGMSPEVASRVAEPFFTTKERGKGTGLGLSMVQGFVQQSGGRMLIETEEGRGTTVHLVFERASAA